MPKMNKCELCGDVFIQEQCLTDTCPGCTEKILADMNDTAEDREETVSVVQCSHCGGSDSCEDCPN